MHYLLEAILWRITWGWNKHNKLKTRGKKPHRSMYSEEMAEISEDETIEAIRKLKIGKAPWIDKITLRWSNTSETKK